MTLWTYSRRRIAAFLLDYLPIAAYLGVLAGVVAAVPDIAGVFANRISAQVAGILLVTLPVTFYFALSESSAAQASWGKARIGLKVIDRHGQRIGFARSLARTLLKFVPWEISHTLVWETAFNPVLDVVTLYGMIAAIYAILGANALSVAMTKTRQTLYDLLCGARVAPAAD